jgi:hypothetical protein
MTTTAAITLSEAGDIAGFWRQPGRPGVSRELLSEVAMSRIATRSATLLVAGFALSVLAPVNAVHAEYYKRQKAMVTEEVALRCQQQISKKSVANDGERDAQFRECLRKDGKK